MLKKGEFKPVKSFEEILTEDQLKFLKELEEANEKSKSLI